VTEEEEKSSVLVRLRQRVKGTPRTHPEQIAGIAQEPLRLSEGREGQPRRQQGLAKTARRRPRTRKNGDRASPLPVLAFRRS
jgi:hypothetical protein